MANGFVSTVHLAKSVTIAASHRFRAGSSRIEPRIFRGGIRLTQNNGYLIEEAPPYRGLSQ
jgi:hypothetical protein